MAVTPCTSDETRTTWPTAPEPTPETLGMGGGLQVGFGGRERRSRWMGGRHGARGPRDVFRGGGIGRTSPEAATAGGATRNRVKREIGRARDGWVGVRRIR